MHKQKLPRLSDKVVLNVFIVFNSMNHIQLPFFQGYESYEPSYEFEAAYPEHGWALKSSYSLKI